MRATLSGPTVVMDCPPSKVQMWLRDTTDPKGVSRNALVVGIPW